jgi:hypothetical protein
MMKAKIKAYWNNPENKAKMKAAMVEAWEDNDERRAVVSAAVSEARSGTPLSAEHKASIKAAMALRSDEVRYHSAATRRKISEANKGRRLTPEQQEAHLAGVHAYNQRTDVVVRRAALKRADQLGKELLWHRCVCDDDCKAIVKDPVAEYAQGHHPASKIGRDMVRQHEWLYRGVRGEVWMVNSWEVLYAHYLDSRDLEWEYEKRSFDLLGEKYTPDFFVPSLDEYVDVKGYFRPADKRKIQLFRQRYPDIKLKLVFQDTIDKLLALFDMPPEKSHGGKK